MKIIYINSNPWENKSADIIQTLNTVSSLSKKTSVIFITSWISNKIEKECYQSFNVEKNFKHIKTPVKIFLNNFIAEKITRLLFCLLTFIFIMIIKTKIIYTRDFGFLFFLSKVPKFLKKNLTVFFEAHKIYHKASEKVNFLQEKQAIKEAHFIVSISNGVKEDMMTFFNISEEKILVAPSGVNVSLFKKINVDNSFRLKYKIKDNEKVVLYSGSFLKWKGVESLVYAFEYLKDKNYKLLLVGGSGKDLNRINKLVSSLSYKDKIVVVPMVDQEELIKIISFSDIAVIPNNQTVIGEKYTSPMKVFEYIASGMPIIASKLPSMTAILKENENALFFEPENSKDLADKIVKLIENETLRDKMSNNNQKLAKEYSWEKRAEKIISFIKESI